MSKNYRYEIFVYRIYDGFNLNLCECSMNGYYYMCLPGCI